MRNLIFAIIFISPPFLKRFILKWFCGARFGRGSGIGWFSSIIGSQIELGNFSTVKPFTLIRCDGEVRLGNYTEVSSFSLIYGCASFKMGDKCYIGPQSLINVSEDVVIGNGVGIGARTMIYTHGSFLPYIEGYWVRFGRVTIGNQVWIAAGVFVHPGVEIGDNVFVNSRSVVSQSIPSGKVVEGFPAREICSMEKIRRTITPLKRDTLILNLLKHFTLFMKQTKGEIQITRYSNHVVLMQSNGKAYLIALLNSKGVVPPEIENGNYSRVIILLNKDGALPSLKNKMVIFNFSTMKASYSRDKLCRDLYLFLKMYYGLIFEFD